jgi:hypothetical protein
MFCLFSYFFIYYTLTLVIAGVGWYPLVDKDEYGLINFTDAMFSIPSVYKSFIYFNKLSY